MDCFFFVFIILVCDTITVDGKSSFKNAEETNENIPLKGKRSGYSSEGSNCLKKDSKNQCIAIKAAQEAKSAQESQQSAAVAVAKQVKIQLAEKAYIAAKAAEVAYNAKLAEVENLESAMREAQEQAQQELANSIQTQNNLRLALNAAEQAGHLLKALTVSLQVSEANLVNIQNVAIGTQKLLTQKSAKCDAAKARVEALLRELRSARQELCYIKQAACVAMSAAKSAQCTAQQRRRNVRSLKKSLSIFADALQLKHRNV